MLTERDQDSAMSDLIEAHARHLRAAGRRPKTINGRVRLLWQLHRALPFGLAYASTDELEAFLQSDPTWKPWTKANYAMHMRGFYGWAHGKYLQTDPTEEMAKPRTPGGVPNPVTDEELERALARSPEPIYTAIVLAAYAGLRCYEIVRQHREDITEESIRILEEKGGGASWVDTHPALWEVVQPRSRGLLVVRDNGREATENWLSGAASRHFDRVGLPGVTMHRFRHWYGSTMLDATDNLRTVQVAMRHRSITSTVAYTLVKGGQRRLAIRSLPTLAGLPTRKPTT
jgi:integrase